MKRTSHGNNYKCPLILKAMSHATFRGLIITGLAGMAAGWVDE